MPDKATAQKMGRRCFAYTPSNNAADWALPICNNSGNLDAGRIGGAAAAVGKGFRGEKANIPDSALAGVKAKIRAAWRKVHSDQPDSAMPDGIRP